MSIFPTPTEMSNLQKQDDQYRYDKLKDQLISDIRQKYGLSQFIEGNISTSLVNERVIKRLTSELQSNGWAIRFERMSDPSDGDFYSYKISDSSTVVVRNKDCYGI